jgi:hypothetical protein
MYNAEKYTGIKCALPTFKSTMPTNLKGLEKHYTPIKMNQSNSSTSFIVCLKFNFENNFSNFLSLFSRRIKLLQQIQMEEIKVHGDYDLKSF